MLFWYMKMLGSSDFVSKMCCVYADLARKHLNRTTMITEVKGNGDTK